jgi:hypothetical protein
MKTKNWWDTPIGIAIIVAIVIVLCAIFSRSGSGSSDGPRYPLEDMSEDREMQAEYAEMTTMARHDSDPCYQDILDRVPPEYSRCGNVATQLEYYTPAATISSGCPTGCTYHKTGCDIKGNVSFNTGEKIYHLPGDSFYGSTTIDPAYGERWFCTEAEALANGWRHAYQ